MSWKNLEIAKKLYIGFGIVLILTLVTGWVSYDGLTTVSAKVEVADDANRLIKIAQDCRQAEKNYIIRDDDQYIDELHKHITEGITLANELEARLTTPSEITAINECIGDLEAYQEASENWAQTDKEGKAALQDMVVAGRRCEAECENLRTSQKEQMEQEFASRASSQQLQDRVAKADAANRMLKWILQMRRHEKNFVMRKDTEYVEKVVGYLNQLKEQAQIAKGMMKKQENRDQIDAVVKSAEDYELAFDAYQSAYDRSVALENVLISSGRNVVAICGELRRTEKDNMQSARNLAITMTTAFVLGAVLIGVFIAFFIARGVSRPVSQMARVAEKISTGDINHTIELESKDEVGVLAASFRALIAYMQDLASAAERIAANDLQVDVQPKSDQDILGNSFRTMLVNLTQIVRQMSDNATQLVSAANEVASSSEQMSRGANDQTAQMSQVSSAIEEMTATILESSRNAGEASDGARNASDTAANGGEIVSQTICGMQRIADVVRESSDSIGKLASSADQIGQIIGVIDDIADQTNLLALNAAIEAARAGDQGRGFAVVADEVRKLAERTGQATGEITEMIKGIQSETQEAVRSMETGIQEVDCGRELTDKAGNSLNEIVTMNQRVMDMIRQIATASEQQSTAAEQISKNVENVTAITKETATGAQQSAAAAEELNRQAEGMQKMVSQFRLKEQI